MRKNGLYPSRRYSTAAERRVVVGQFRESGLTQKDFAARQGMRLSCLTRWLRAERLDPVAAARSAAVEFHSLALPALPGWAAEVQRAGGTVIRFQAGTPPALAVAILGAAR